MSFDQSNKPIFRAAFVMQPQASCPIALGQVGWWLDKTDNAMKLRNADGSDTAGGGGSNTWKEACRLATAAALGAGVYDAVALTFTQSVAATEQIDGKTVAVGDRVLVKNQVDETQNGIYVVTVKGTGSVKQKLTRAPDCKESAQFEPGFLVPIAEGTANADSVFEFTADAPFTMDASNATFSLMPISITYAGTGDMIALDGGAVSAGVSSKVLRGDAKQAVSTIADGNLVPGIPVVHEIAVPDAATGHTDYIVDRKIEVVDVIVRKDTTNGGAGDTLTIGNGATAITDAMDLNKTAKTITRAGTIDAAQAVINAGGTLRINWNKVTNVKCQVTILAIKRA